MSTISAPASSASAFAAPRLTASPWVLTSWMMADSPASTLPWTYASAVGICCAVSSDSKKRRWVE